MSMTKKLFTVTAPLALLALSACATPFRADVARFQVMPPPEGQTYTIQAADPRNQGGIEFSQYATLVGQRLEEKGYRPAASSKAATLVVTLDYGVDDGKEKIYTRPGFSGGWGRPWGWGGWHRSGWWGWNDPWDYPEVDSYTYYTSHLDMVIDRAGDGQRLFEGRAKARSRRDSLPALVPNLVEAMFTNFPGRSGEEVTVTIPPPAKG